MGAARKRGLRLWVTVVTKKVRSNMGQDCTTGAKAQLGWRAQTHG
jgi:hypothetical protein